MAVWKSDQPQAARRKPVGPQSQIGWTHIVREAWVFSEARAGAGLF